LIRIALAVAILGAELWLAILKQRQGLLEEMLYACHVAAVAVAVGLVVRSRLLVAAGGLFHLAIGLPAWIMDVLAEGTTTIPSLVIHLTVPAVAIAELRRGIPRGAFLAAWLGYVVLLVPSYLFTDPALNVNLAHRAWGPLEEIFRDAWLARAANCANAALFLGGASILLRRFLVRPA
jgi:hypothetical protein